MSYDIRNQPTATAQRTAEIERLNYLALKSRLNQEYEQSQFQRQENERLGIEPAIPIYRTKDELLADLTTQRQILKFNLKDVMDQENITEFLSYTFKQPEYALLTNEYWHSIEPQLVQFKPLTASFLYEWLNRYFFMKQKMGTKIDVVVDPEAYGDLNDIAKRASHFIAPKDLTEDEIKVSVREMVKRNYGFDIDPYSSHLDNDIRDFYIQEKVIMPTKKLTPADWKIIYDKEIQGYHGRIGAFLPKTQFAHTGFKKGSELGLPSAVIKPEEDKTKQRQVIPGTIIPVKKEVDKTAQEVMVLPTGEIVPVALPQKQAEIVKKEIPLPNENLIKLLEESPDYGTFRDTLKQDPNFVEAFSKDRKYAFHAMKKLAREFDPDWIKNVPNPKAPDLFTHLKDIFTKKGSGLARKGKAASKGTPIAEHHYKFGKYTINKRGLKKKF